MGTANFIAGVGSKVMVLQAGGVGSFNFGGDRMDWMAYLNDLDLV